MQIKFISAKTNYSNNNLREGTQLSDTVGKLNFEPVNENYVELSIKLDKKLLISQHINNVWHKIK